MVDVKDFMTRFVLAVAPDTSVQKACQLMTKKRISSIIVTDGKMPLGIMTERDVVQKVCAPKMDPSKLKVKDVMTSPLEVVEAKTSIFEASKLMSDKGIKKLGVVDGNRFVGIISQTDVITNMSLVTHEFISKWTDRKLK